ncbi:MAG: SPFH domain-containing protein [Eubacteriaceae bacterium]|nr:SPFH domain-containing protein [Eubacteriaceae bacterium]
MEKRVVTEKILKPISGLFMLPVLVIALLLSICLFIYSVAKEFPSALLGVISWVFIISITIAFGGLKIVRPIEARIFTLFGSYHGTIKTAGYYFVNPFCSSFSPTYNVAMAEARKEATAAARQGGTAIPATQVTKTVSLKMQTFGNQRQKVNDILGNPIIIGAVVIWHVEDPTKAVFAVENYYEYLGIQTDSTIRNVARLYPYDVFAEDEGDEAVREKTLRGSSLEIADTMQSDLQSRIDFTGLVIDDVRITHLAYAEEIAAAMLQRQQAVAIIAARQKIVDGAVGMVKMAIEKLGDEEIVLLDEERKAAMVSNLLVVLCGNRDAQPIINSGSIY